MDNSRLSRIAMKNHGKFRLASEKIIKKYRVIFFSSGSVD